MSGASSLCDCCCALFAVVRCLLVGVWCSLVLSCRCIVYVVACGVLGVVRSWLRVGCVSSVCCILCVCFVCCCVVCLCMVVFVVGVRCCGLLL